MDNGDKTTQKKALLGKLVVEWEHRVATSPNSPFQEPANTPTHHPGDNSNKTTGTHQALRYKEGHKRRTSCSMHLSSIMGRVRIFLNDGTSTIATEDMMQACNRDNRGKDDINAPVDMNSTPTTVPFRVWNPTGVEDYPPPSLSDKNRSDLSTGNALGSTNAPSLISGCTNAHTLSHTNAQGTNAWTGKTATNEDYTNAPTPMLSDKITPNGRCCPKAHNKNSNAHPLIETHGRGTTLYYPVPPFILGDSIFADFGDINGKQRAFVLEAQHPQYYLQLESGRKVCTSTKWAFLAPMIMPCKQNDIGHDCNYPFAET
jgi:hypothetical protein